MSSIPKAPTPGNSSSKKQYKTGQVDDNMMYSHLSNHTLPKHIVWMHHSLAITVTTFKYSQPYGDLPSNCATAAG